MFFYLFYYFIKPGVVAIKLKIKEGRGTRVGVKFFDNLINHHGNGPLQLEHIWPSLYK